MLKTHLFGSSQEKKHYHDCFLFNFMTSKAISVIAISNRSCAFPPFFLSFLGEVDMTLLSLVNSMNKLKVCEIYAVLIQNLHI